MARFEEISFLWKCLDAVYMLTYILFEMKEVQDASLASLTFFFSAQIFLASARSRIKTLVFFIVIGLVKISVRHYIVEIIYLRSFRNVFYSHV
jgi:hypothetical protein